MNEEQPTEMHGGRSEPLAISPDESPVEPRKKRPVLVAAAVCAVALIPVLYLSLNSRTIHAASGTQPQPTVAPPSVEAMEAAVKQYPSSANRLNLSLAYIDDNAPGRAKPVLHDLLAQDAGNVAGWNNLCVAQVMLRELKDAVDDCNHALSIDGSYQLARNNLKWAEDVRQQELDALNKMQQTSPGDRDAAFFIEEGTYFLHLEDYDKAINSWQRVLLLESHNAIAANNIGTAFMMKKQPETAMAWFVKAADWDPAMQIAKNNMAWAEQQGGASHPGR
jgi:Tfp pilus assembly protein PilF